MDIEATDTCSLKSPLSRRSNRSMKIQRLADCQHFHYPSVELGPIKVKYIAINPNENGEERVKFYVESESSNWIVEKSRDDWAIFDRQLHRCVFERQYSRLQELYPYVGSDKSTFEEILITYTDRLSELTGSIITCYPVLKFLEIDSKGGHFEPAEETSINVPAIAAAVVTKEFEPTHCSHLRLKIGDIVSITEMTSHNQSDVTYWKAKLTISNQCNVEPNNGRLGFEVGYFPSDCVTLITDKRLANPLTSDKKQNTRNARRYMSGIFRNRRRDAIFGVELTEIYCRNGRKVPSIVEKCCSAIEDQGIVTGIYRQCGIQSNIQRLRAKFDSGAEPDLQEFGQRDIYSVSSLLKQYFRQLPNPLFTYHLYEEIMETFEKTHTYDDKVKSLRSVLEKMPEAHYRTAKFLLDHLHRLCQSKSLTDMTSKNLAIVWSPNLFRPPPTLSGADAHLLSGLNVHTAVCDFLIENCGDLFTNDFEDDLSKCSIMENSFTFIPKSATISDMRSDSESKWPRFFRGKSVEGFWKFNKKPASGDICSSPTSEVKWRRNARSHSTDSSFHSSRTDSFIQLMHNGMDQLREGMRLFRARARSMRPMSRPPHSPTARRARLSQNSLMNHQVQDIQNSITTCNSQENGSEGKPLTPPIITRTIHVSDSEDSQTIESSQLRERKVMFQTTTEDINAPIHERSSPVEEWSSDSRESLHLEMSRYDNVPASGTFNRKNDNNHQFSKSLMMLDTANHLFIT